jgi:hypothetical protein
MLARFNLRLASRLIRMSENLSIGVAQEIRLLERAERLHGDRGRQKYATLNDVPLK